MDWSALSSEDLIQACVRASDTGAWEEFVRRFRPVIAATAMRTARRFGECEPQLIDDLVQDTYLKICANRCRMLRDFRAEAPDAIFGFLKKVAFSVAHDYFRGGLAAKRRAGHRDTALDTYVESTIADPNGLPKVERDILIHQIDEHLTENTELATEDRDRRIFWLFYRHGMTSRAIAAIPCIGLTQKGVESVICRLTKQLRTRLADWKPGQPKGKSADSSL